MFGCLFCGSQVQLSNEHVFPAAFGCPWTIDNAVCRSCNNRFNSSFEGDFIKSTAPLRALLRIKDRYGKTPEAKGTADILGNRHPVQVQSDGKLSIPTLKVPMAKTKDGQPIKLVTFNSRQEQQVAEGLARRKDRVKDLQTQQTTIDGEVVVPLDYKFLLKSETLRSVAKIAYVGLAYVFGSAFANSESFEGPRKLVLDGKATVPPRLFHNRKVASHMALEPNQFALVVACDGRKGLARAAVFLFGTFSFLVSLSDEYRGPDILKTIAFDGSKREEHMMISRTLLDEYRLIREVESGRTTWDSPAGGAFRALVRSKGLDVR